MGCRGGRAPTPAKVIWQSQIIPPSPVTSVKERNTTAKAIASATRPSQNTSRIRGRAPTTAAGRQPRRSGRDPRPAAQRVGPGPAFSPWGRIARSSAPPTPSFSHTRPARVWNRRKTRMKANGMLGITAAVKEFPEGM